MKSLSLRNLNNCFTLAVAIESREVVGDMVGGKGRRIATSRHDRRSGNYRELRNTNLETDHRNVHEEYSDITEKVKVDVPSFDEKIDATTFSNWLVAKEDYFDWHEMFDIERLRFAK